MLVAQRVNNLITELDGRAICDRCICKEMGFRSHAHSAQITGALGTTSDFVRDEQKGECSRCGEMMRVIRRA